MTRFKSLTAFGTAITIGLLAAAPASAAIVTADLKFNWDADNSAGNGGSTGALVWTSTNPATDTGKSWSFDSGVGLSTVSNSSTHDRQCLQF